MKDNVLVLGSGGREHAISWKLSQSEHVGHVYVAPGNGGTEKTSKCSNVKLASYKDMLQFAKENGIRMTFVGPEQPLVDGIADSFRRDDIRVFGPGRQGARLEGSKAYAKEFMGCWNVPTATFESHHYAGDAEAFIDVIADDERGYTPQYVKASGLAAGKGAISGRTPEDAKRAIRKIMRDYEFGPAGDCVVIEDLLEGEEASLTALVNSHKGIIDTFPASQDHKKIGEGETGDNTGGMGAYAPTTLISPELSSIIYKRILEPTISGLREDGISYIGSLYPGIIVKHDNGYPYVLEFNVRMGDPETQALLPLLETDFYEAVCNVHDGQHANMTFGDGYAVCVVLASKGYPGRYEKGKPIEGLDELNEDEGVMAFHAGTRYEDGKFYTSGGRVLGVTARGNTISRARDRAYEAVDRIRFENKYFRKDIGMRETVRPRG
ncbi:MAG: phosphoribosylamine--glycine ligase [Candidatus Aenigmarchaeota archaeon]|nr:phosphoribosylamine--glycine ligase [Candidatus Aenigmarchaeota archaeon]